MLSRSSSFKSDDLFSLSLACRTIWAFKIRSDAGRKLGYLLVVNYTWQDLHPIVFTTYKGVNLAIHKHRQAISEPGGASGLKASPQLARASTTYTVLVAGESIDRDYQTHLFRGDGHDGHWVQVRPPGGSELKMYTGAEFYVDSKCRGRVRRVSQLGKYSQNLRAEIAYCDYSSGQLRTLISDLGPGAFDASSDDFLGRKPKLGLNLLVRFACEYGIVLPGWIADRVAVAEAGNFYVFLGSPPSFFDSRRWYDTAVLLAPGIKLQLLHVPSASDHEDSSPLLGRYSAVTEEGYHVMVYVSVPLKTFRFASRASEAAASMTENSEDMELLASAVWQN